MVALPQVPLAVGGSKDQTLEHSTVLLGTQRMVGLVVSTTVTVNVQRLRLVQSSVASHVTTVLPTGNKLPEGGEHVTITIRE